MQTTLENLNNLLQAEKFEEAGKLLEGFFGQSLTEAEEKQAYLDVLNIYLDIATHFANQKKELLQNGLKVLEDFEKKEKKLTEVIDIDELRKKIQAS